MDGAKRNWLWVGAIFLVGAGVARAQGIEARINALLAKNEVQGASVGIAVVEVGPKGAVDVFSHNAGAALGPASCAKLLTTAAAFIKYGPHTTFKTELFWNGPAAPAADGADAPLADVTIVGSGDPGLGDVKISAARGEASTAAFDAWAQQLTKRGIRRIRDVLVDDRVFDHEFVKESWPTANGQRLSWFEAPIGGLNFNANCLDWLAKLTKDGAVRVELTPPTTYGTVTLKAKRAAQTQVWMYRGEPGTEGARRYELRGTVAASMTEAESVSVDDPGLWTGSVLKDRLTAAGIAVTGTVKRVDGAGALRGQWVGETKTEVIEIIRRANKNSVNMMAEGLCKRLGYDAAVAAGKNEPGSWPRGTGAVEAFVRSLGVPGDRVSLADGSGLSADNKVAAGAFTAVLAHVAAVKEGELFVESLATPSEDGTLKRRFRSMPAVAKAVHGKTGHIKGVSALSGYLDVNQRRFAFSILTNNSKFPGDMNLWEEKVVEQVWEWAGGK